jgi:hypothetical protein
MIDLGTLGVAVLGNAIVMGIAIYIVNGWISTKFDEKLAKFQSELEKKNFVSNSLYKNRESTILEFDLAWRGFVGSCRHLIDNNPNQQSEFDYRFDSLTKYYLQLQTAFFRGSLVFDEKLLHSSKELINICRDLKPNSLEAIRLLADEKKCSLNGIEADPNFVWDVNEYLPIRDEIHRLLGTVLGKVGKDWESNARDALQQIK